jgi:hypothetical protein
MIQRVLRHSRIQTQMHYRHSDPGAMREAMRGVGFAGDGRAAAPLESQERSASAFPRTVEFAPPPPTPGPIDPKNPSKPGVRHAPQLDPEDVAEARELRARGWTLTMLRARYRVSKSTLSAMLNGETHRDVPPAGGV